MAFLDLHVPLHAPGKNGPEQVIQRYRAAVVERARHRTRVPWWLFHGRPSPYPPRVQAIGSLTVIALVAAFVGVAYAAGFTWPWRHAYIAGPLLGWLMYLPMRQWLRTHGYWDDARLRRYEDDQ